MVGVVCKSALALVYDWLDFDKSSLPDMVDDFVKVKLLWFEMLIWWLMETWNLTETGRTRKTMVLVLLDSERASSGFFDWISTLLTSSLNALRH